MAVTKILPRKTEDSGPIIQIVLPSDSTLLIPEMDINLVSLRSGDDFTPSFNTIRTSNVQYKCCYMYLQIGTIQEVAGRVPCHNMPCRTVISRTQDVRLAGVRNQCPLPKLQCRLLNQRCPMPKSS